NILIIFSLGKLQYILGLIVSYDVILNILSCVAYYAKSYLSDVHNSPCRCFLQKLAYYADVNMIIIKINKNFILNNKSK
ncbi:hypothetical protein BpHYR1_036457, partial [Brachionus plicatilis]